MQNNLLKQKEMVDVNIKLVINQNKIGQKQKQKK